jgi:hypothetical protein
VTCCSLLSLPPWFFPPRARWCQSRQGLSWVAPSLQSCYCSFSPILCMACRTLQGLHRHAHTRRRATCAAAMGCRDCAAPANRKQGLRETCGMVLVPVPAHSMAPGQPPVDLPLEPVCCCMAAATASLSDTVSTQPGEQAVTVCCCLPPLNRSGPMGALGSLLVAEGPALGCWDESACWQPVLRRCRPPVAQSKSQKPTGSRKMLGRRVLCPPQNPARLCSLVSTLQHPSGPPLLGLTQSCWGRNAPSIAPQLPSNPPDTN